MHPLSGSNISTLCEVLRTSGGVSSNKLLELLAIVGAVAGRSPFTLLERIRFDERIEATRLEPPPIFILGHWRSGTTHLYNVMSKGNFGYVPPIATGIPWDILQIGAWLKPLLEKALPADRYIDNIPVNPDSPQEDEIALANMTPISYYHGIYFPKKLEYHLSRGVFFEGCSIDEIKSWQRTFLYFLKKLSIHQGRKQLLIKNPAYTARPAMLKELIPTAKFIHISRNPYEVFESMRNFYSKLFAQLALQDYSGIDIDQVILETYSKMMTQLNKETKNMSADIFIDIRYEDLEAAPLEQLEKAYNQLGIEGFELARPKFKAYLSTVTSYKKNKYSYTDEAAKLVEANWAPFLKDGDYKRPGLAA